MGLLRQRPSHVNMLGVRFPEDLQGLGLIQETWDIRLTPGASSSIALKGSGGVGGSDPISHLTLSDDNPPAHCTGPGAGHLPGSADSPWGPPEKWGMNLSLAPLSSEETEARKLLSWDSV